MSGASCDISSASSNIPVPSQPVLLFMLIAYPILTIVGSIGNLLSAFILHPFRTHVSGHVYLACLAIFDTLSLIFNLISFWNMLILKRYLIEKNDIQAVHTIDRLFGSKGVCEIRVYLSFTVRMWSVWTVVILTTERFLLILFPLRFQKFLSPKVAWITIGCSTLLIGLISLPWLFSFSYVVQKDCSICLPNRIFRIQLTVQILLVTLLPAIILLFTNIKIALTLAKRRYRWMEMGEQTSTLSTSTSNTVGTLDPEHLMCESHQQAYKQEQQFVLRLLLVSMLFWILNLPLFMYGTLREIQEQAGTKALATTVFMNGYFVSQFLSHLNNCVNFYVYCFIGSTFREATLALLVCDWRRYTYWSAELQKGYLDTSDTPLKGFPHCTHKKEFSK